MIKYDFNKKVTSLQRIYTNIQFCSQFEINYLLQSIKLDSELNIKDQDILPTPMSDKQYEQVDNQNQKNQHYQQEQYKEIEHEQYYQKKMQQGTNDHPQNYRQDNIDIKKQQEEHVRPEINHLAMGKYANPDFQVHDQSSSQIKIAIAGTQTRGNALTKHSVYLIRGEDKNGEINVARRFKQFFQMRAAMTKRWPGCFIPSMPARNALNKNSPEVTVQRQRYLNDFIKKIAKLPYLYYAEQFQCLLRSKDSDCSSVFQKWNKPTSESIISKYRESFNQLNGKQINADTNNQIAQFYLFLKKNQPVLQQYVQSMKKLAQSRDKLDKNYSFFFSQTFPNYQKNILTEYVEGRDEKMLYANPSQAKLAEHAAIATQALKQNPYWLLYDVILSQQRDAKAFLESLNIREHMDSKRSSIETKILNNQKTITDLALGKKNFTTITTKGSNDQIKYKLEVQIEELKKQKESLLILSDIVAALIVYIQIPKFKRVKSTFYENVLRKIGGYEINVVQNLGQIWAGTKDALKKIQR